MKHLAEYQSEEYPSEEHVVANTLKFLFRESLPSFPYISTDRLKEAMVEAGMSFKDTVSYNRLFQDLADPNDEDRINLK